MIENIVIRKQTPSEGKWLYEYDENSNLYYVSDSVFLGKDAPEWKECTEEEKIAFEKHNEEVLGHDEEVS